MKKMMFGGLLSLVFLSSCGWQQKPLPIVKFSDEFRAYTQFGEGSYWIYKDSLSEDRDTIKLYNKKWEMMDGPSIGSCTLETAWEDMSSSYYKKKGASGTNNTCERIQSYGSGLYSGFFMNNTQYGLMVNKGTVLGDSLSELSYIQMIDNLVILGNPFYYIRVYEQHKFKGNSFTPQKAHWAKNVGIVRKETSDGKVWLLERYKAIQ